jgi:DNA-binding response OmpR family regulator
MATLLIAEDDQNTRLLTSSRLKPHFDVICACDGQEALNILEHQHVDLIVADIMMPHIDGYTLVKMLRDSGNMIPVLMLTAKHSLDDKRTGFSSGTDDYMVKPIDYEELIWRIHALLRRAHIASEKKIILGSLVLDSNAYTVSKGDDSLLLPKKEFELLYKLLSYPGIIFTKNQLLDEIWGYDSESYEDTIKTHISRLRNKFKEYNEFKIITLKGLGYKAELATEGGM